MNNPSPDTTIAAGDPGDETLRRYRFQWTYAASLCVMLLDESYETDEVFCEHHEDILVKRNDGQFIGIQVKTRESDQPLWKAKDESVVGSCAKFTKLEIQFPGQFKEFRFLSNHPLYAAGNSNDLREVLNQVKLIASVEGLERPYQSYVRKIAREADCSERTALMVLQKTTARDDLPKLRDTEIRLVGDLTSVWIGAEDLSYRQVEQAATNLAVECQRASSLAHQDILPAYFSAGPNPEGTEQQERLAGKRFDRQRVHEILEAGATTPVATLNSGPSDLIEPGIGDDDLLSQKLDAGGFSAVSLNSAADLRNKADYLGLTWIKKHGEDGLQRYQHVRSIVHREAADAFEETKNEDDNFGVHMLHYLRSRLKDRFLDGTELFDCSSEHLEGYAYSLTSECKVQWSIARPWETE